MNAKIAIMVGLALLSMSCSQRVDNFIELSMSVFDEPESVLLTREEVSALNYAAQYLQIDGKHRLLAPLNQALGARLTWRVGSYQFIHTQHGRVVASDSLPSMPMQTSPLENDPLQCLRKRDQNQQCGKNWLRQIVWQSQQNSELSYQRIWVHSSLERDSQPESITLLNGQVLSVYRIVESGQWLPADDLSQPIAFENTFWQHVESGRVVKTRQFLSPQLGYLQSEEVVPYSGDINYQSNSL